MLVAAACVLIAGGLWLALRDSAASRQGGAGAVEPSTSRSEPVGPAAAGAPVDVAAREEVQEPTAVDGYSIRVVTAAGEPVAQAAVFLGAKVWRADASGTEALGAEQESDGDGCARFAEARDDWSCIAVIAPGHAPVWQRRAVTTGVETVTLAESVSVAGIVTVDGRVPSQAVRLELRGLPVPTETWPEAARSWLHAKQRGVGVLVTRCRADGAFAFRGLERGAAVRLVGPRSMRFRDGARGMGAELSLATPSLDVRLDLATLPVVRGKLVSRSRADKTYTLNYTFHRAGGVRRQEKMFRAIDQPFAIPFCETDLTKFELEVVGAIVVVGEKPVLARREITGDLQRSQDLGEIDVDAGLLELRVAVRDRSGLPIAGARIVADREVLGTTSASGEADILIHPAVASLTVGAREYRLVRVPVPRASRQVLWITLEPANKLLFLVRAEDRGHCAGLILRTDLGGTPHDDDPECVPGFASVRGAAPRVMSSERSYLYPMPDDGRLELHDLPANRPIPLTLCDEYGREHWRGEVTLGQEEAREIRCPAPESRDVRARLVDVDGRAVSGATVRSGGWRSTYETVSDAEGWFAVPNVRGPSPGLSVEPRAHLAQVIPEGFLDQQREVTLVAARQLWVEITDARGRHLDAKVEYRSADGRTVQPSQSERGFARLDRVPLQAGELRVQWLMRQCQHPVGASETHVRVVVLD